MWSREVKVKVSVAQSEPFATFWTVARQTPLSMGFSSKKTGVGCHAVLHIKRKQLGKDNTGGTCGSMSVCENSKGSPAREHECCGTFTTCIPSTVLTCFQKLPSSHLQAAVSVPKLLSSSSNPPSWPLLCNAAFRILQTSVPFGQLHVRFCQ